MQEIIIFIPTIPSLLLEIFLANPLAQIVGFLGFIVSLFTFLSKHDKTFLWRMTLSSFVWAIHFLLLGALSAGFLNSIDVIKNLLAIKYPFHKGIAVSIVIIYIIIGTLLFMKSGDWLDLLPVIASVASTIIIFTLKGVWMRIEFLIILAGWFTYNLNNHSIGGAITDIILFITGCIGIYTKSKK